MFKVYTNGISCGLAPAKNFHERAKRNKCSGWSSSATRNNKNFLYSVKYKKLDDYLGHSFTFTVKNCPPDSKEWHKLRDRFLARMRRMGLVRYHWVTEWQRRGVPHLHGCLWLEHWQIQQFGIIEAWVSCAKEFGAEVWCQDVKRIETPLVWFEYLSKHASRGEKNYQRCNPPAGWESAGKVWGYGGDWPRVEPVNLESNLKAYHLFRRIIKRWRIADGRGTPREIYARKLFVTDKKNMKLSKVMGLSEWLPAKTSHKIMEYILNQGFELTSK